MTEQLSTLPGFDEAFKAFVAGAQKMSDDWYKKWPASAAPVLTYSVGPTYIRVIKQENGRDTSVYCFVNRTNGDILKGSWKAPVKNGVRGNILAPGGGLDKVNWHGPIYLRGGM